MRRWVGGWEGGGGEWVCLSLLNDDVEVRTVVSGVCEAESGLTFLFGASLNL